MTTVAGSDRSVSLYTYIQESAASRMSGRPRLPLAVASIAAIGITGMILAAQLGSGPTQIDGRAAPTTGPVRGEFRLAPGNQLPLGVVIPLDSRGIVPGEFRLGPGNAQPPAVVVPLRTVQVGGAAAPTSAVRGEFRLAPGNQQPLGTVIPVDSQDVVPGEFRLGPGNAQPPGVALPLR
jgi:hypothetical protein